MVGLLVKLERPGPSAVSEIQTRNENISSNLSVRVFIWAFEITRHYSIFVKIYFCTVSNTAVLIAADGLGIGLLCQFSIQSGKCSWSSLDQFGKLEH